MKKTLLLLLSIFILTGCTANYTLKYDDGTFTEYVEVKGDEEDDAHPTYNQIKEDGYFADIDGKEKFVLDPSSSRYNVKLSHVLENTSLKNLKVVYECFELNSITEDDTSYYVSLYGKFTCTNLKNSTFTLETDNQVINHNANLVEKNKYIWNLDEDNVAEDGIKFQIFKNNPKRSNLNTDTFIPNWLKCVIAILILGVSGILVFMLKKVSDE